jgi:hypothetical protein
MGPDRAVESIMMISTIMKTWTQNMYDDHDYDNMKIVKSVLFKLNFINTS